MKFSKPFIIADVGSNCFVSHNEADNLIMAKRHIYDAARCGVSAVKFQMFTDQELYGMPGPNRYAMPRTWLPELASYCAEQGVEFMCTAFSAEGYGAVEPFVNYHKVASAEMKHVDILDKLVTLSRLQELNRSPRNKPVFVSVGGSHELEFEIISDRLEGLDWGLLECVAQYPAKTKSYNLSLLRGETDFVGVSDHTLTDTVAISAAALGAQVFEKHFTSVPGSGTPDDCVSVGPTIMSLYVRNIQEAAQLVASRPRMPLPEERDMTMRWRRRLKVTRPLKEGDRLEYGENFGCFRSITEDPEAGPPERWEEFHGKMARRDLLPGDPVWNTTVEA